MDAGLPLSPQEDEHAPTCGLCQGSLRMGRLLPCLDIFCLECLERRFGDELGNQSDSQPECPTCGERFSIPAGGLKDMKFSDTTSCSADTWTSQEDSVCQFCGDDRKPIEVRFSLASLVESRRHYWLLGWQTGWLILLLVDWLFYRLSVWGKLIDWLTDSFTSWLIIL